jgi:hypothetical protein
MKTQLRNSFIAAMLFAVVAPFYSGCKKGEGDPFLSLRSRKSRMAGEWSLSSGKTTDKSTSGNTSVTTTTDYTATTANETTVTVAPPLPNSTTTDSYGYTEKWTLEKDGTFSGTVTDDGTTTNYTGVWNFTSGVGDQKNKSQMVMTFYSISSGSTTLSYTGVTNDATFDIYQLKNKEIILKQNTTSSGPSGTTEWSGEWTWTQ